VRVLLLGAMLVLSSRVVAEANPIADAVDAMEQGHVLFEFPAREGVRGSGESITIDDDHRIGRWREGFDYEPTTEGPVRVEIRVRGRRVRNLETRVGGRIPKPRTGDVDLGAVQAPDAVEYLLELARTSPSGPAEDAILPAALARGVTVWPSLLELARDRDRPDDVRGQAVFWLGQFAADAAVEGLVEIVDDEDSEIGIREAAVFALSQQGAEVAVPHLMRIAQTNGSRKIRESAFFWLAQSEDPRALNLFEEILSGN